MMVQRRSCSAALIWGPVMPAGRTTAAPIASGSEQADGQRIGVVQGQRQQHPVDGLAMSAAASARSWRTGCRG